MKNNLDYLPRYEQICYSVLSSNAALGDCLGVEGQTTSNLDGGNHKGSRGFGNARAVGNLLTRIRHRRAYRLAREKRYSLSPDYFFFTQEDLIRPDLSVAAKKCEAWVGLQEYIGLEHVKQCVERLIGMIKINYQRELPPGTGKTMVLKLYGRILADLGYLNRGDVALKNPADFIGECLGKSEAKTKKILDAIVGKILVIDEAYMLDAGDPHKEQDKFKTGVIDTIVSMVQGVPGEDRPIILVGYEDKIRDMFHNRPLATLSHRTAISILRMKLREQDLQATHEAIGVARDMFERALMRPNPTNAGEVDKVLATAKWNYQTRQSLIPIEQQTYSPKLEAVDFDPAFDRGVQPHVDCRKMLEGWVHKSVIDKLVGYQNRCLEARRHGLNPRDQVPTNFVFKGFSGTGKTTTAQQMGKIFYGMGFLSTDNVVECSAADLLGQYVGQTAPKTKKKLRDGLGHVLFIDEAYRLASGSFAAEAVEELILFLSQPANAGKMVVILAGLTADMNYLMTRYPSLPGLFPDEIVFHHIPPDECVTLLARYLEKSGFSSQGEFITTPSSEDYRRVRRLFYVLSVVPGWSNARDIKNLSKEIIGQFLEKSTGIRMQDKRLSASLVTDCMRRMIEERKRLLMDLANGTALPERPQLGADNMLPSSGPAICVPGAGANNCAVDTNQAVSSQSQSHTSPQARAPAAPIYTHVEAINTRAGDDESEEDDEPGDMISCEDNVADSVWYEVCEARRAQELQRKEIKAKIGDIEEQLDDMRASGDGGSDWTSRCDAIRDQLTSIQTKMQNEQKPFDALEQMGRCVAGFCWYKVAGGYRCEGGSHYVADGELSAKMK
ncbi:hypothetical protein GQX73_g4674 [Xylaria multiplex]|uniref:ATPase AAA-type core domain-containing protein n=1 Tax=Xylaria multiplex TaxID=323545 RepID=A0A7C8ISR2_9PEZI|nr:hypothetical protein GQX73_g4674 [Xylaria multiplex]